MQHSMRWIVGGWFALAFALSGLGALRSPAGELPWKIALAVAVPVLAFLIWSRPRTVGRGKVYHYIITVPATSGFSDEQFVGQLTTVSQTVRMTITSFTILKTSIYARELKYDFVAWTDVGRGGPFEVCQGATCANTGDYLRLLVFATPPQTSGSVFTTPGWNAQGSVIMGIARQEFDLRTIPDDRPLRAFTFRSPSGEIEFEVQGTLEVVRR